MPPVMETDIALLLGEIKGQLRELIHSMNNQNQMIQAIGLRVAALEAEQNKRVGASGIIAMILKSPAIGWLVGAAVASWAVFSGKVHP